MPEVRHVTLPTTGGRIVIASDGVWDAIQPKGVIHQVCVCLCVMCAQQEAALQQTQMMYSRLVEACVCCFGPPSAWTCVILIY